MTLPLLHEGRMSIFILFGFFLCVLSSPFLELNDQLHSKSDKFTLGRSSVVGKEIGVFTEQRLEKYSNDLRFPHKDWIDPYGMLHLTPSLIEKGSIQEQIWNELIIGRGSIHPMLIILNQGTKYIKIEKMNKLIN